MALVRTYVLEVHIASIITVTRISELGTLAVTSNRSKLRRGGGGISSQHSVVSYCEHS
jgi:predicted outer membrane repeat protein